MIAGLCHAVYTTLVDIAHVETYYREGFKIIPVVDIEISEKLFVADEYILDCINGKAFAESSWPGKEKILA